MARQNKNVIFLLKNRPAADTFSIYPGEENKQFKDAYRELIREFKLSGAEVFFAMPQDLQPDGTITRLFSLTGQSNKDGSLLLQTTHIPEGFLPGLVINRSKDQFYQNPGYHAMVKKGVQVLNGQEIAELGDKVKSLSRVSQYLPETIVLADMSASERSRIVHDFLSRYGRVVLKPQRGNAGKGVVIADDLNDDKVKDVVNAREVYILQQYVENSSGVPGLVEGRHDVRLYVVSGVIIAASIRKPQPGSFLSNTSQGGTINFYNKEVLPKELLDFGENIIAGLNLPKVSFISLDFFYSGERWYLIELNDQPGIPATYQDADIASSIQKALAVLYNEAIK